MKDFKDEYAEKFILFGFNNSIKEYMREILIKNKIIQRGYYCSLLAETTDDNLKKVYWAA